jgi:hypothetical protein
MGEIMELTTITIKVNRDLLQDIRQVYYEGKEHRLLLQTDDSSGAVLVYFVEDKKEKL